MNYSNYSRAAEEEKGRSNKTFYVYHMHEMQKKDGGKTRNRKGSLRLGNSLHNTSDKDTKE